MFFKEKLVYEPLEPYINKPFSAFDVAEVEEYFKWYQKQIPCRVEYLSMKSQCDLDYAIRFMLNMEKPYNKSEEKQQVRANKAKIIYEEMME